MTGFRPPKNYKLTNVSNGLATVIAKDSGEVVGRVMFADDSFYDWIAEDTSGEQMTHTRRSGPYTGTEVPMTFGSRDSAARSLVYRAIRKSIWDDAGDADRPLYCLKAGGNDG
jgi:hypothetical protein